MAYSWRTLMTDRALAKKLRKLSAIPPAVLP